MLKDGRNSPRSELPTIGMYRMLNLAVGLSEDVKRSNCEKHIVLYAI